MKTVRVKIDLAEPDSRPKGRVDLARVVATTKEQIADQIAIDEQEARQDALKHAPDKWPRLDTSSTPDQNVVEATKT
ncbi:hypothetical protein [Pusillimonas sp. ANT_WB101]|uniref:hypothetical protein n=1 Tax=Pusillimonas sp. ANT_WB101 TaxID=2597356 RepID=UPI0011EFDF20|nr:hypothetical protein [Pusillimonas sp. ANT_WB101]KAA0889366.1 hypothetical protein FQ179_19585 [Pusillimonas sp. ANT_WB101]